MASQTTETTPKVAALSLRQWQFVQLLADGYTLGAVAVKLKVKYGTARKTIDNIYEATGCKTLGGIVAYGFRHHMLDSKELRQSLQS